VIDRDSQVPELRRPVQPGRRTRREGRHRGAGPPARPGRRRGCEGWRPNSRRGGMGSLESSRPASFLSESAARADRPKTIRGFRPSYRSAETICTPDRERSGRQPGSVPARVGRTRPLGSVVPRPVVVVGPVVPGALVPIVRIVAGLRRATATAVDAARGRSGSAGRGRAGAGGASDGGRPRACVRSVRASSVVRSGSGGRRRGEDRGGYRGRHGRRSTMRPPRRDRVCDPGERERGCDGDRQGPARPRTAQRDDGSRDVDLATSAAHPDSAAGTATAAAAPVRRSWTSRMDAAADPCTASNRSRELLPSPGPRSRSSSVLTSAPPARRRGP
jgi:hypothetical protein